MGVERFEPVFEGPSHDVIKKRVQLFSRETIQGTSSAPNWSRQEVMTIAMNVMFTQMQAIRGIKLFGEKAIAAIVKELKQFEHRPMPGKRVVEVIYLDGLTLEEKKQALNAVNLIKEKRDGTIKGRTCADGS